MPSRPKNIILIVADSLRYDSVYQDSGPSMPYAEQNAVQFSQARTSGCWTLPAHASMFTGLMPHQHGATSQTRRIREEVPTLAERLKEAGYYTHQITANVVTTDIFGLDRGFDQVDKIWEMIAPRFRSAIKTVILLGKPRVRRLLFSHGISHQLTEDLRVAKCWVQNTYRNIFRRSQRVLNAAKKRGQGTFLFMNLMETHFPYHVGPTFRLSSEAWKDRLGELAGLYHLVNQSFLTSDREYIPDRVGEILRNRQHKSWRLLSAPLDSFIQELHEDQDNLVVFMADHGDNFGDQGWYYHFTNVTDAGNRVPLLWLGHDHQSPRTIHHPVSSRFLHNSILHACDLPHQGPGLFNEDDASLPILQSYWYDNQGRTLPKYKYNQLCFVEGDRRFLKRKDHWMQAPRQEGQELESDFEGLGLGIDPIEEFVEDRGRRDYLRTTVGRFEDFSASIPT